MHDADELWRTVSSQAQLFSAVTNVPCVVIDRHGSVISVAGGTDYPCAGCVSTQATARPDGVRHLAWVDEAIRFGGQSIFLCENALTHWTAPVYRNGVLRGALVAGPVLTIDDDSFFENEIAAARPTMTEEVRTKLQRWFAHIPRFAPVAVTRYAELLTQLARALSAGESAELERAESLKQQSRINEYIQELKVARSRFGKDPDQPTYPVDLEMRLLDEIRDGSVNAAQGTLNELLSHVFFAAGSEMSRITMRAKELIVLLSRTVVREGGDPQEVFGLNYQFAGAIDHQTDLNGVAYWMARIVRRFAGIVLYLPHLTHARALRRAKQFVRETLPAPVRLPEAAAAAGISATHLSRVFKQEIGVSFVDYVNGLRCEAACALLLQSNMNAAAVAEAAGFSDHSYFTRVFKKHIGKTPSEFQKGSVML